MADYAREMAEVFSNAFTAKELIEWIADVNMNIADPKLKTNCKHLPFFLWHLFASLVPAFIEAKTKEDEIKAIQEHLLDAIDGATTIPKYESLKNIVVSLVDLTMERWSRCSDADMKRYMNNITAFIEIADLYGNYVFYAKEVKKEAENAKSTKQETDLVTG